MTIYQVLRNADMTEGRGPMLLDKAFTTYPAAYNYVQTKFGVMGTEQYLSPAYPNPKSNVEHFNGYDIVPVEVVES